MLRSYYIDGNNLLHAMRASAPIANVGRETMVRLIEKWVSGSELRVGSGSSCGVTLFFDGPKPRGAMASQMASPLLVVEFSAPRTADDLLIDAIHACRDPGTTAVVTADRAILHEAGIKRCQRISPTEFIEDLFREPAREDSAETPEPEKPSEVSAEEAKELSELLGEEYDGTDLDDFESLGL